MKALHSTAAASAEAKWRRIESIALLATIPAFYLAMLPGQRMLSVMLYVIALVVSAGVTWADRVGARKQPPHRLARRRSYLGLLLCLALLLCAVLPQGDSPNVLIVRLGTAALVLLRWSESAALISWRSRLPQLLGIGVGVLGLCGLGFWWLEPKVQTFGDGLWLAFTTAATVGYGDIVPSSPAAKIFAVFVVLMGLAVLSLVTASIAALLVQTEERRIEHELLHDLHCELQAVRDELAAIRRESSRTPAAGTDTR